MESEEAPHQDRGDDIEHLVEEDPTKRPGEKLQSIGKDGYAIRGSDAAACERRQLQQR